MNKVNTVNKPDKNSWQLISCQIYVILQDFATLDVRI